MNPEELPPGVRHKLDQARADCNEIFDTLERVKGEAFSDAVRVVLTVRQMQMLLQVTGAPENLIDIHAAMCAQLTALAFKALKMEEQVPEVISNADAMLTRLGPMGDERH